MGFLDYEENSFFDGLIVFLKTRHTSIKEKLSEIGGHYENTFRKYKIQCE